MVMTRCAMHLQESLSLYLAKTVQSRGCPRGVKTICMMKLMMVYGTMMMTKQICNSIFSIGQNKICVLITMISSYRL